jgi:predicted Na+-dependent transporter
MHRFVSFIQNHVGVVFCSALIAGLLFPVPWKEISSLLMPLMIFLLFLSFLQVDASHVVSECKRPWYLARHISLQYIFLPVLLFFGLRFGGFPTFATAVFLLSCMPAGLGSPVFTGIANGRIATSVVLSVLTHIIVPLSVPVLFWAFADTHVAVDTIAMGQKLAMIIGIPIVLAWVSRCYFSHIVVATKGYHKLFSIFALAAVAYVVIVPYSSTILHDVFTVFPLLLAAYAFFAVLCVSSFLLSFGSIPEERIAIVVSRIYMNNALGIVLAAQFFGPDVTIIIILSEIPWFTSFGLYLWFQRRFITVR